MDPYLVRRFKQLNANGRKPCPLHVYHEINCIISINRPVHLFIKVISNTVTPSWTQDKITCNSAVTEEKNMSSVLWVSVVIDGDIYLNKTVWKWQLDFWPLCDVSVLTFWELYGYFQFMNKGCHCPNIYLQILSWRWLCLLLQNGCCHLHCLCMLAFV